ncbi:MAG: tRNA (adenosine(37)-N6)-threonylcarbamoyltransferase complex ATPase subunit type 1 TsaE, partial [Sphingomonadales bacterium]|nr:tRNA (adenosine(37)-N6)-threonylcarbamoyltransferase complex ATPase subunit type 1 TsaE [Sphingomonadales bacterium]
LEQPEEARELGLDEARREAALIVEWPARLGAALWADSLRLELTVAPRQSDRPAARRLTATVPAAWEDRWPAV